MFDIIRLSDDTTVFEGLTYNEAVHLYAGLSYQDQYIIVGSLTN